jgi:hypothetical protein
MDRCKILLYAIVEDFSTLPYQSHYRVIISFPNGLNTQYGKEVPSQLHFQGRAEVITEERRVIERLFDKLKAHSRI